MRMQKRKFRIGELAKQLNVERFVIRFWEKEFAVKTSRSTGGQRFYDEDDLALFSRIKTLLYKEGFTIAGAKKQLSLEKTNRIPKMVASRKTTMDDEAISPSAPMTEKEKELSEQIMDLQEQLIKLRQLL